MSEIDGSQPQPQDLPVLSPEVQSMELAPPGEGLSSTQQAALVALSEGQGRGMSHRPLEMRQRGHLETFGDIG